MDTGDKSKRLNKCSILRARLQVNQIAHNNKVCCCFFTNSIIYCCQLVPQLPLQAKSSDLSMVASKTPGLVGGLCFNLGSGHLIGFWAILKPGSKGKPAGGGWGLHWGVAVALWHMCSGLNPKISLSFSDKNSNFHAISNTWNKACN